MIMKHLRITKVLGGKEIETIPCYTTLDYTGRSYWATTLDPKEVTCKMCKYTKAFRSVAPHLALTKVRKKTIIETEELEWDL